MYCTIVSGILSLCNVNTDGVIDRCWDTVPGHCVWYLADGFAWNVQRPSSWLYQCCSHSPLCLYLVWVQLLFLCETQGDVFTVWLSVCYSVSCQRTFLAGLLWDMEPSIRLLGLSGFRSRHFFFADHHALSTFDGWYLHWFTASTPAFNVEVLRSIANTLSLILLQYQYCYDVMRWEISIRYRRYFSGLEIQIPNYRYIATDNMLGAWAKSVN